MKKTALVNGRIITPLRLIENARIIIGDDTILEFGPAEQVPVPEDAVVIDVNQAYISPGFIDLHIHGCWGGDIMSASEDDLAKMLGVWLSAGDLIYADHPLREFGEIHKIALCGKDRQGQRRG